MPIARVAILYPGPSGSEERTAWLDHRFGPVVAELRRAGADPELTPYRDEAADAALERLRGMDAVLVWVNPIEDGRGRAGLDAVLREVAGGGVFVSAHPDVIRKMGTKDVLVHTRGMGWSGGDVHTYGSAEQLRADLPQRLAAGTSRVLKQLRGNGGHGVWRVALADARADPGPDPVLRVLEARGGSPVQEMPLRAFAERCRDYFVGEGRVIDQPFRAPGPAGMVRCYMTHAEVVGFGQQRVTALLWSDDGQPPPPAEPRRYHPPTHPEFQALRARMESAWIPEMQRVLDVATEDLPVIWDADFLCPPGRGPGDGGDVLCEINVSCVHPFPDAALPRLVRATLRRAQGRR
jgi:hypothetical protein